MYPVAMAAACQAAAATLGKSYFSTASYSLVMSNCFWDSVYDDFSFNTGGSVTGTGNAVCTTEAPMKFH